jgi:hypothetical protein
MKDQPVVIFGGPGAGSLVAQLVNNVHAADKSLQLYGFLNDELIAGSSYCGTSVLGNFESWRELPEEVRFVAHCIKQNTCGIGRLELTAFSYQQNGG